MKTTLNALAIALSLAIRLVPTQAQATEPSGSTHSQSAMNDCEFSSTAGRCAEFIGVLAYLEHIFYQPRFPDRHHANIRFAYRHQGPADFSLTISSR